MNRKLLFAALVVGAVAIQWLRSRPNTETVLPNGFVLRQDSLLSADRSSVLSRDIEFVCFDDRFIWVISKTHDESGLFDTQTQSRVAERDHPEIRAPGGLVPPGTGCNGYHAEMIGPGLLHGTRAPFLPSCDRVNRDNPALRDRRWFDRPCADDRPPRLPAAPRP